jgi:oligopeptide/dipeptide ABC transporter ATP-binding protein
MSSPERAPIVVAEGLSKTFDGSGGLFGRAAGRGVDAVTDMSFAIPAGGSLALVGESGSGKTTTARMIVGLEAPTAGRALVDGTPVPARPSLKERRSLARLVQMVFQDPYVSLDPRQSVRRMLDEVISFHTDREKAARSARVVELVEQVGLPASALDAMPRELSGGQRQRAAIARALAPDPRVLVLDEAVSALDTSVQAQILNLFADLRKRLELTYLVISHDLAVARQISDEIVVMYRGAAVETGRIDDVLRDPRHPYTRELLDSIPRPGMPLRRRLATVARTETEGCRFRGRCPVAFERCVVEPGMLEVEGTGRTARCWRAETGAESQVEAHAAS